MLSRPRVPGRVTAMDQEGAWPAWPQPSSGHHWSEGLRLPAGGEQGLNRLGVWSRGRDNRDEDVFEAGLMGANHG